MIENYLIKLGMRCGTVKNFNNEVLDDVRRKDYQHWYFKTPIKSVERGGQLKEAVLDLAFPFLAERNDLTEKDVLSRLNDCSITMQADLIAELRKRIIVPQFTFILIPFWANEKASERNELKDFGNNRIHILNAQLTVQFREHWF